jgi:hypothetical protein
VVSRSGQDYRVTVAGPSGREMIFGFHHRHSMPIGYLRIGMHTRLLACRDQEWFWDWDERFIRCLSAAGEVRRRWMPQWTPAIPPGSPLATPVIDYSMPSPGVLEVVGIDGEGILHWSKFDTETDGDTNVWSDARAEKSGFRAACLHARNSVIAVTGDNELMWIHRGTMLRLSKHPAQLLSNPTRIAAVVSLRSSNEIVAILDDGSALNLGNLG